MIKNNKNKKIWINDINEASKYKNFEIKSTKLCDLFDDDCDVRCYATSKTDIKRPCVFFNAEGNSVLSISIAKGDNCKKESSKIKKHLILIDELENTTSEW